MKIEKISQQHDKKSFDCGSAPLNNYLKNTSGQHEKKHLARTFVLTDNVTPSTIIGYYTLALMTVEKSAFPNTLVKKLPEGSLHCTLLGRLAVDKKYQSNGYGGDLLIDAILNSYKTSLTVPTPMLVVDAKDSLAKSFYQQYGFIQFPELPFRLFLTMKDAHLLLSKLELI